MNTGPKSSSHFISPWAAIGIACLLACLYGGYRAYQFYGDVVKPAAKSIQKAATNLSPIKGTNEPKEIEAWVRKNFSVKPPKGFAGVYGFKTQLLGQPMKGVMALGPQNVPATDLKPNALDSAADNHTLFIFSKNMTTRDTRQLMAKFALSPNGKLAKSIVLTIRGNKIAAYRQYSLHKGKNVVSYTVWLSGGRTLTATGPKSGFKKKQFLRILGQLTRFHPNDPYLSKAQRLPKVAELAINPKCKLRNLPANAEVHFVQTARGSIPVDYQIGEESDPREEKVVVGTTKKPVILVLNSSNSVMWEIGTTPTSKLAGVLVSSQEDSGLTGVSPNIPQKVISGDNSAPCKPMGFYTNSKFYELKVGRHIRGHVGKDPVRKYLTKNGKHFTIGKVKGKPKFQPDTRKRYIRDAKLLPVGKQGLAQLVKQGHLRLATMADANKWLRGAKKLYRATDLRSYANIEQSIQMGKAYVMLKNIVLPERLYGAHSVTFLVPPGVSLPKERGHCTFLLMKDFGCEMGKRRCRMKRLAH